MHKEEKVSKLHILQGCTSPFPSLFPTDCHHPIGHSQASTMRRQGILPWLRTWAVCHLNFVISI